MAAKESAPFSVSSFSLHRPSEDSLMMAIEKGIKENFEFGSVTVVECPDLTESEWDLSSPGLCGSPVLLDLGDGRNLQFPDRHYNCFEMANVISECHIDVPYVLGAAAASLHVVKKNGELLPNINLEKNINKSLVTVLDEEDKVASNKDYNSSIIGGFANLFASQGKVGKVIRIHGKERRGEKDFIECIRCAITASFPDEVIGLGGVFQVVQGKIKSHVMPGLCDVPITIDYMLKQWLRYFEVEAPLVCQSIILSDAKEQTGCRSEHTHFKGTHCPGGHYHHDTTPKDIEYLGYFVICENIFRIRNE